MSEELCTYHSSVGPWKIHEQVSHACGGELTVCNVEYHGHELH